MNPENKMRSSRPTAYACTSCTWTGNAPSSTESKSLDEDLQVQRRLHPICPECFKPARALTGSLAQMRFREAVLQVTDLTPRRDPRFYAPTEAERAARLAHLQAEIDKARSVGLIP